MHVDKQLTSFATCWGEEKNGEGNVWHRGREEEREEKKERELTKS